MVERLRLVIFFIAMTIGLAGLSSCGSDPRSGTAPGPGGEVTPTAIPPTPTSRSYGTAIDVGGRVLVTLDEPGSNTEARVRIVTPEDASINLDGLFFTFVADNGLETTGTYLFDADRHPLSGFLRPGNTIDAYVQFSGAKIGGDTQVRLELQEPIMVPSGPITAVPAGLSAIWTG
jgi:hypothetical protein